MKYGWLCTVLLLSFLASATFAVEPSVPSDFAYGLPVEVEGDSALYELILPPEFYRGITRSDLSDFCMFNARGKTVPHALRRPVSTSYTPPVREPLPIFPIWGTPDLKMEGLSLKIRRDSSGAIIDMDASDTTAPERRIVAYLLDASSVPQAMNALELEWQPVPDGFVGRVLVEHSDDLDHWKETVKDATLVDLHFGNHSLVQRKINLKALNTKYLRLSWPELRQEVKLTAATVELVRETQEEPRQWTTVEATVEDDRPGEYHFDTGGVMPISRIQVRLPQKNTLAWMSLFSRAGEKDEWHLGHSSFVYDLRIEGQDISNPDLAFHPVSHRYWLLSVDQSGGGLGEGMPVLEMGWVPQKVLFVARGDGPYTLAYGSANLEPRSLRSDDLFSTLTRQHKDKIMVGKARTGTEMILGGESKLRPAAPPFPWKTWLLWVILLLGVILMSWMALRLYKQMELDKEEKKG